MATAAQRAQKKDLGPDWRETLSASIRGFVRKTVGVVLVGLSIALGVALITHSSVDPSFTTAAGGPPTNWLGSFGAYASDALLFLFGPAAVCSCRWSRWPACGCPRRRIPAASARAPGRGARRRADRHRARPLRGLGRVGPCPPAMAARSAWPAPMASMLRSAGRQSRSRRAAAAGADGDPGARRVRRRLARARPPAGGEGVGGRHGFAATRMQRRGPAAPTSRGPTMKTRSRRRRARARRSRWPIPQARSLPPPRRPRKGKGGRRPARPAWRSATITSCRRSTCSRPPPEKGKNVIDRAGLERNARLLESVLEDFHVRGDIVEVRPGPVVTMYELEPASGIKASRVIQLADDIARNMSALVGARRDHPGPQRDRHRASQPQARDGVLARADRQPGVRGPEHGPAADPGQEYLRRPGHRRPRADAASARRRHDRIGQVGRPQLHDPVAALPDEPGRVPDDHDRSQDARAQHLRRHPAPARARSSPSRARRSARSNGPSSRWRSATG